PQQGGGIVLHPSKMPNIGRIVPLKSSLNTPADDVDASATKSNTRRMNGSGVPRQYTMRHGN
ncbi:MAG: hypothetical protein WA732_16730, partial [Pseudolabrys sp.]